MKKCFLFGVVFLLVFAFSSSLYSAPVFFSTGGEKLIKVRDFPDTPAFRTRSGKFVDAGYLYKQVTVFFVPVWNYEGRWVGYTGSDTRYLRISEKKLKAAAKKAGITLPDSPTLPFWDAVGGKLVIAGLALLIFVVIKIRE